MRGGRQTRRRDAGLDDARAVVDDAPRGRPRGVQRGARAHGAEGGRCDERRPCGRDRTGRRRERDPLHGVRHQGDLCDGRRSRRPGRGAGGATRVAVSDVTPVPCARSDRWGGQVLPLRRWKRAEGTIGRFSGRTRSFCAERSWDRLNEPGRHGADKKTGSPRATCRIG